MTSSRQAESGADPDGHSASDRPEPPPRLMALLRSRWGLIGLATLTGVLLGYSAPGHDVPFFWVINFVPLFLALDLLLRFGSGRLRRRWLAAAGLCWWVGVLSAVITGGWVVNTAHVYGGLPLAVAHGVNALGYGSLLGIETFLHIGLPFLLAWEAGALGVALFLLWSVAVTPILPRFLFWTYGEMMFRTEALVQAADLAGSAGLNLPVAALHLLLFGWIRHRYAPRARGRPTLIRATAATAVLFAALAVYGMWRMSAVDQAARDSLTVRMVGIQPNFSLKEIASNPSLSPSDRRRSVSALIADTDQVLENSPVQPGEATVVVWPESAYPGFYAMNPQLRKRVESWVRRRGIHLVLAIQDAVRSRDAPRGYDIYGASLLLAPNGRPAALYRKMVLIPFGETIPLGDWFPWYRDILRRQIPQIAEFTPGQEYTVFDVAPGVRLAPMICFDAARYQVTRGMVSRGANVGVVQANMAWFGRSTATDQFEQMVRFRAIENRIPLMLVSQSGTSVLIDAKGRVSSPRLEKFVSGSLDERVPVSGLAAPYTAIGPWVQRILPIVLLILVGWRLWPRLREIAVNVSARWK